MKLGLIFLVACAATAACTSGGDRACTVGAECASGVCRGDGTCAPPGSDGGLGGDTGGADGTSSSDGGSSGDGPAIPDGPASPDGPVSGCVPNQDGTIVREEIPLGPGLHGKYRVAQNAGVSTAGTSQADGSRVWDLTGALPGDHALLVETLAPTGQWFAADFASATYTARLSDSADLLGVFQTTPASILLLGEVSPASGATSTKLTNSAGVPTLSFPMKMGSSWTANVNVTGTAEGIAVVYTEAYETSIDAHGTMKTPFADFSVLRVNTKLTRTVGVVPTVIRTFAFVAECAGPVATMVSQNNETVTEFTSAAEVQRLAP